MRGYEGRYKGMRGMRGMRGYEGRYKGMMVSIRV